MDKIKEVGIDITKIKHIWIYISENMKEGKYVRYYTDDERFINLKIKEFSIEYSSQDELGKTIQITFN